MRKWGIKYYPELLLLIPLLLLPVLSPAQNTLAGNQPNYFSLEKEIKKDYSADTSRQRQKLFNVLKKLNQSRGIYFFISDATLGDLMVTPVADENQPIEKILDDILKNTGLKFRKLNEQTFIILPGDNKSNDPDKAGGENISTITMADREGAPNRIKTIRGRVIDKNGLPVENASVIIRGTTTGTVTSGNGQFMIDGSKGAVLEISSIGYIKKAILLDTLAGEADFFVTTLENVNSSMEEVVVTALGVKKNSKSLGYSVNSVPAKVFTASANTNFASALYGRVPGLRITTAPGGATSAVQVQVRGLNSLNFNSQPLFVLDGVIIRDINEKGFQGINNGGFWSDQRIRGNGLLDINPSDIESLTVLKGASATALYGSEAACGVIVITTKKGEAKPGLGVEFNYSATVEKAAFLPDYQDVYGPGYDRATNLAQGATEDGWIHTDLDGDGISESYRPNFNAYAQFGPKMEGQLVSWWDGKMRPYIARPDNYKNLYRTGINSIINTAFSNQNDKASYRVSFTHLDYRGIQQGGSLTRNTLHFNSTYKINDRFSTDLVASYVKSKVHNRPLQLNRILASYSGFISRTEDINAYFEKYQTTQGYKWVPWNEPMRNPAEALKYNMKFETLDFLWTQLRNSEDEDQDRFLSSLTINYSINDKLKLRGRFGNDFTSLRTEAQNYNEYPVVFNSGASTGQYTISDGRYSIIYGDALLTYSDKLNKNISFSLNGGYQARKEQYTDQSSTTDGGLVKENWFSLDNSYNPLKVKLDRSNILRYAFLGFFNLSYKNYFFLEGTARQEYSSTLPPYNNSYFYSSANTALVFTELFKSFPSFVDYGKIRASYGLVGNAPSAYASIFTYSQTVIPTINGPVTSLSARPYAGNNKIRPENKYETELGLELMLLRNRLGIDITWYHSRVVDQIIQLTVPASSGAISEVVNAGELQSKGIELAVTALPITGRRFNWNIQMNLAADNTIVKKLANGVKQIFYFGAEQNSIRIVANEGERVGDIYVYPRLTDDKGNYVIGSNGLYIIDNSRYKKVGNVMPRFFGGISNSISFKNLSLDIMTDYRVGGQLVSPALKYNIGAGMYTNTLQYRDAEHGGLPYYIDGSGTKVLLPSHDAPAPNGARVYHDGIILPGVSESGNRNTTIVDAAYYYYNMFSWGPASLNEEGSVYDNSYVKIREVALSYTFPEKRWVKKMHLSTVKISLVGRNLFYVWRTLKNLDPEAPVGSNWIRQSIDEGSMAATRSFGFTLNVGF